MIAQTIDNRHGEKFALRRVLVEFCKNRPTHRKRIRAGVTGNRALCALGQFPSQFRAQFRDEFKVTKESATQSFVEKIKLAVALIEPVARMTSQLSPACHP